MIYRLGAEMFNFGALIAFMGECNSLYALLRTRKRKKLNPFCHACCGWFALLHAMAQPQPTGKIAGAIWMTVGIAFGAWKTRGFRRKLD